MSRETKALGYEELPPILEAVEWVMCGMLERIDDREERERFVLLMKLAWNLELVLREDVELGMSTLSSMLGNHENRDRVAGMVFDAIAVKRERYADDPRRITTIALVDGPSGERLAVDCELFAGLHGKATRD